MGYSLIKITILKLGRFRMSSRANTVLF